MIVAALAAGCAAQAPDGGTTVVPQTPHSSAPRAGAAATPGGACPAPSQWQNQPAPTSIDHTPANTPQAEELSQAVGTASREPAFADVYGTQITDFPPGRVALCVTDLAGGHLLADAAKRIDPHADLSRLDLYLARYSAARLNAAAQALVPLLGRTLVGFPLNEASAAPDASSVQVDTSKAGMSSPALRQRLEQLTGGIPVTFTDLGPATAAVGGVATPG